MLQELLQWSKNMVHSSALPTQGHTVTQRQSKDGRATLLQLANSHPAVIANYELKHEDGRRSIIVNLYHLRKLYENLEQLILLEVQTGHFSHAESLWQQYQTIDLRSYTHHLQVFHLTKTRQIIWSMDIDFHKPNSYGSGTAVEIFKNLLISLLNKKYIMTQYQDSIELLLKED
jgi:hypothetical protein